LPFFCRFALCDDMEGGGGDWVGCDFFCVPGLFKMLSTQKQIAGLITHYFGGNCTPKLGNSDFETTSKQGLRL
jgi:hypothetical protein